MDAQRRHRRQRSPLTQIPASFSLTDRSRCPRSRPGTAGEGSGARTAPGRGTTRSIPAERQVGSEPPAGRAFPSDTLLAPHRSAFHPSLFTLLPGGPADPHPSGPPRAALPACEAPGWPSRGAQSQVRRSRDGGRPQRSRAPLPAMAGARPPLPPSPAARPGHGSGSRQPPGPGGAGPAPRGPGGERGAGTAGSAGPVPTAGRPRVWGAAAGAMRDLVPPKELSAGTAERRRQRCTHRLGPPCPSRSPGAAPAAAEQVRAGRGRCRCPEQRLLQRQRSVTPAHPPGQRLRLLHRALGRVQV